MIFGLRKTFAHETRAIPPGEVICAKGLLCPCKNFARRPGQEGYAYRLHWAAGYLAKTGIIINDIMTNTSVKH